MNREPPGGAVSGRGDLSNELSGTVFGPNVQAGAIHGDVHLHSGSRRGMPPVPRQLPPRPHHFTSRRAELDQLDQVLLGSSPGLVVLTGPGGVGKTALATYWAHNVQARFPDGQLYVDLGGFSGGSPADPAAVLGSFLRALGVNPGDLPVGLAEQVAFYRSVTAGRALLVILDNAFSAAQVRVLVPATGASVAVVTSRSRLVGLIPDGARLIEVTPLPEADSVALLTHTIGAARVAREPERTLDLVRACGGWPIALSVAAARLAARPKLSVGRVASELADEANRLPKLSVPDGHSVQAAFDTSYRALDASAAQLYRRLALHPGHELGREAIDAVTPAADALELLVEANLLQETAEDRFRFHDLVRLHARQRAEAEDTEHDRARVILAYLEWYFAVAQVADQVLTPYRRRLPYKFTTGPHNLPPLSTRDLALRWLEQERVNLMTAGRVAFECGYAELAWHLSDVLWPLFLYGKHYRDRMEADERGVAAARRWKNRWAEADMLKRLSRICAAAGEYAAGEQHAREAIRLYQDVGDVRGSIDAQESMAALHRDAGRTRQAIEGFAEVLAANRRHGEDRSTALTLINLGMLLSLVGRYQEAIPLLQEARDTLGQLSAIDPYNEARAMTGLAGAYMRTGDLAEAEDSATAAANRMAEIGSDHGEAEAIDLLGQISELRGDIAAARTRFRRALATFEALGSSWALSTREHLARLAEG